MASLDPQKKPDLFIIRGDSYSIAVNMGMDITGGTVYFTAKPALTDDATDTTAVIAVQVTSHTNAAAGTTVIALTSANTNVVPGEYFYDIQVKIGSAITSIPVRKLKVYADATRRTS